MNIFFLFVAVFFSGFVGCSVVAMLSLATAAVRDRREVRAWWTGAAR